MAKKKKKMQWEVRKLDGGKWGIYLKQEFCRTEEPVCYAVSATKESAELAVDRLNNPMLEEE